MSEPSIGAVVPDITATATGNRTFQLNALRGRKVVLYFYPRDATPGCTTEGQQFRDHYAAFQAAGAEVFGVSRDSLASHEKFKSKQEFPFELISDPDETLCKQFGVIKEKNMYGRKVLGIERSTFLIDAEGKLAKSWRKVRVKGHVEEVLAAVQAL